jgi:DNA-directed RNA polymerase specialized sigma24 family protein
MQLCLDRLDFLRRITTAETRKLRVRGMIPRSAEDDIVDELVFEVIVRLGKFDESRGSWEAFVTVVVRSKLASILRRLRAAKRDFRRERSMGDQDVVDPCSCGMCWQYAVDLRLDLEEALLSLDDQDRAFAADLSRKPIAELARESGVARSTLRGRRDRLGERLGSLGLDIYCEPAASSPTDGVVHEGADVSRGETGMAIISGEEQPEGDSE